MKRLRHLIPVLTVALGCYGATKLRSSSKGGASLLLFQPKVAKVAPSTAALMPPAQAFVIVKPPKPFHLHIIADPVTNAVGYKLYFATNGQPYRLVASGPTPSGVVSNLWPNTVYVFTMTASDAQGQQSDMGQPCYWPRPVTNFFALGFSATTNGAFTTNTIVIGKDTEFFRLTNGALQSATNLRNWATIANWTNVTGPAKTVLRCSRWDNFSVGYAQPD